LPSASPTSWMAGLSTLGFGRVMSARETSSWRSEASYGPAGLVITTASGSIGAKFGFRVIKAAPSEQSTSGRPTRTSEGPKPIRVVTTDHLLGGTRRVTMRCSRYQTCPPFRCFRHSQIPPDLLHSHRTFSGPQSPRPNCLGPTMSFRDPSIHKCGKTEVWSKPKSRNPSQSSTTATTRRYSTNEQCLKPVDPQGRALARRSVYLPG